MAEPTSKNVRKKKATTKKTAARKRPGQAGAGPHSRVETQDVPADSPAAAATQPGASAPVHSNDGPAAGRPPRDREDRPAVPARSAQGPGWAALGLGLAAVAMSGYIGYVVLVDSRISLGQYQNRLDRVSEQLGAAERARSGYEEQVREIHARLVDQESKLAAGLRETRDTVSGLSLAVRDQVNAAETRTETILERFRREMDILSGSVARLQENLEQDTADLVLKEAAQLVNGADFRLRYDRNVDVARQALEAAHRKLEALSMGSHAGIIRQLEADLEALAGARTVDARELMDRLAVLDDTAVNLDLAGDLPSGKPAEAGSVAEGSAESGTGGQAGGTLDRYTGPLLDAGRELLDSLGELIQIEKQDELITPILSADMRQLVYERTRLLLDEARISLVQQRYELFADRLQRLREWAERRFDLNSEHTRQWLALLDEVRRSIPGGELPDLSGSVRSVQEALSRKGLVGSP